MISNNGMIRQSRFKLTIFVSVMISLIFFVSIGADIWNAFFLKQAIGFSDFTITLGGAFIARWIDAWSNYFKAQDQEDQQKLVNNVMNGKNGDNEEHLEDTLNV